MTSRKMSANVAYRAAANRLNYQMNEDMISVDKALGPLTPEMRCAIRWVAFRAVQRELSEGQQQRIRDLAMAEENEQQAILELTDGDTP